MFAIFKKTSVLNMGAAHTPDCGQLQRTETPHLCEAPQCTVEAGPPAKQVAPAEPHCSSLRKSGAGTALRVHVSAFHPLPPL